MPRPQRPAFLDSPPTKAAVDSTRGLRVRTDSAQIEAVARELADAQAAQVRQMQAGVRSDHDARVALGAIRESDADYKKALGAPVMVESDAERRGPSAARIEVADTAPRMAELIPASPQSPATGGIDDRDRRERELFLANARDRDTQLVVKDSAGELLAGTVISAVLLTDVNSDLPGDMVAQVTRDVFDSRTERVLLIPKGSRLIGRYDDRVATGQRRLLVAWTRLVFADGRSIALPGLQGTDERGAAGIAGGIDQHIGQQFGDALLLSLLGAGVELSQPRVSAYGSPSVGAVAGGALGQELSNVALELVRRHADVPPTISVPLGSRFDVYVNRDLVLGRSG
jgi:type IV secretory pathway VirB10-like protein